MKQPYEKPVFRAFLHKGSITNEELAKLDDDALSAHLMESGMPMKAKHYRICTERYVFRQIAGESVLIPIGEMAGNEMIMLNETAAFLMSQMEQPAALGEIIERAREVYDDPQGHIENQIFDCIDQYLKAGIIREEA